MTHTRTPVLPPRSTQLEIDLAGEFDLATEYNATIDAFREFKYHDIPDNYLLFLTYEYGLDEVQAYLPDLRTLLVEGIQWQRRRGTPSALHMAMEWIDHDGTLEEVETTRVKWFWYQWHLPFEVRNTDFHDPMFYLQNASKPTRSRFARVTAGYDKRAFVLNRHRLNGGALLNDWSGVRKVAGGPKLSLRYHHDAVTDAVLDDLSAVAVHMNKVHHLFAVAVSASTETRSSVSASFATKKIDPNEDVPFTNAPWSDTLDFEGEWPISQSSIEGF